MQASQAITERYCCKTFQTDAELKDQDLQKILALTQRAPTCFNSQPWVAVVVPKGTPEGDDLIKTAFASNQQRMREASATVVFCADLEPTRNLDKMADLSALQGYDREQARARALKPLALVGLHIQPLKFVIDALKAVLLPIVGLFTPVMSAMMGESTRTWAIKQAMFPASTFMIAATSLGYQTCPMEGFDAQRARRAVGLSRRYLPAVLICIGKEAHPPKSATLRFAPAQVFFNGHASRPMEGIVPIVSFPKESKKVS